MGSGEWWRRAWTWSLAAIFPFVVEQTFAWRPAPVETRVVSFTRSTPGCTSKSEGVGAWFYEEVPLVIGGCSPELQDSLNRELLTFSKLDPDNPRRSLEQQANSWLSTWRAARAEHPGAASTSHYSSNTTAAFLYNGDGLLTVEVAWVGNGGHQNWYETRIATWDVTSGQRVDAKGLVSSHLQSELAETAAHLLLERSDINWAIRKNDKLQKAFVEHENVAIVDDGLLYCFDPFEISGRGPGIIRHTVPWSVVRALRE